MPNRQNYDPFKLLQDVQEVLRQKGLDPQPVDGFDRVTLATKLLKGYGIEPIVQPESVLDLDGHARYHRRMEGDQR